MNAVQDLATGQLCPEQAFVADTTAGAVRCPHLFPAAIPFYCRDALPRLSVQKLRRQLACDGVGPEHLRDRPMAWRTMAWRTVASPGRFGDATVSRPEGALCE